MRSSQWGSSAPHLLRGARPSDDTSRREGADCRRRSRRVRPQVPSLLAYLNAERGAIAANIGRHIVLVVVSLLAAILIAFPLGMLLTAMPRGPKASFGRAFWRRSPVSHLLAFMIPLLGIGDRAGARRALLYSLYPILRNTYTGVRNSDPATVDAAMALGMTPQQVLAYVRVPSGDARRSWPVSAPRPSSTSAPRRWPRSLAPAGWVIRSSPDLALSDTRMILSGAIPAALLALAVDGLLGLAESWASNRWPLEKK